MIAFIRGDLLTRTEGGCLVLTSGGVGYELSLTAQAHQRLPERGEEVAFFVSAVIREDAFDLYGFETPDEREIFGVLLSVSKLGPKKAMAILSHFDPQDLCSLVAAEDVAALTAVPGIGKKSGQQILLELKFKLQGRTAPARGRPAPAAAPSVLGDALDGMAGLGYEESEVRPTLTRILEEQPDLDVSALLREGLKAMAAGK